MSVAPSHKPHFRLRTILLVVHLFVLIVPLGSIYIFRLYENELVRQTESELIAQGAYISVIYKQALSPLIQNKPGYGLPVASTPEPIDTKYTTILPVLDLAKSVIHPPRPDGISALLPDPLALKAGKAIFPVVDEATLMTLAGVRVTDYQGVVVAGRDETGLSLAHVEEVAGALQRQYTAVIRKRFSKHAEFALASISRSNDTRIFIAMPIVHNERVIGTVLLSRSPRNILKGLYDDRDSVLLSGGIILGVVVLLALLTSFAISRPIYALIEQAQRVARGEKNIQPIEEPVTQELALLSENISTMAATIAERSDYIRNFAMHVSHEFKTPLTAIQGAVELILEHGNSMPPDQLQKFLINITKDTSRLKILVSRLLELARADVMQPEEGTCNLSTIIQNLRSDHQDKQINLVTNNEDNIILPIPEIIARSVFGNLIENSFQHGATKVTITSVLSHDGCKIVVQDNGQGISPSNAEKLFTPFFTTKREQGGTGLGLVILRSMLVAYNATITNTPQENGAAFTIVFLVQS